MMGGGERGGGRVGTFMIGERGGGRVGTVMMGGERDGGRVMIKGNVTGGEVPRSTSKYVVQG